MLRSAFAYNKKAGLSHINFISDTDYSAKACLFMLRSAHTYKKAGLSHINFISDTDYSAKVHFIIIFFI